MSWHSALLYAYPKIEKYIERSEKMKLKIAFGSFGDRYGTYTCIDKIITLSANIVLLKELSIFLTDVFRQIPRDDIIYFQYKYFKTVTSTEMISIGLDYESRNYYRIQNRLLNTFIELCKRAGWDEEYIAVTYGGIPFISYYVNEGESRKIKKRREKKC